MRGASVKNNSIDLGKSLNCPERKTNMASAKMVVDESQVVGFYCNECGTTPDELAFLQNKEEDWYGEAQTMECCSLVPKALTEDLGLPEVEEDAHVPVESDGTSADPAVTQNDVQEESKEVDVLPIAQAAVEPESDRSKAIPDPTLKQVMEMLAKVTAELEAMKSIKEAAVDRAIKAASDQAKKNHKGIKPKPGRMYVRLTDSLNMSGKVPQQQADIAKLIIKNTKLLEPFTEEYLFDFLIDQCGEYASLCKSVQHPTWLFAYYRGLDKKNMLHFGYIKRGFLRQIN